MDDRINDIIISCAEKIVLPRWRNLAEDEVQSKTGPKDLVTIADIEAEYYLQEQIIKLIPKALVAGEESISRGEYSISDLDAHKNHPVFIVDPIDGTNNFVKGSPVFAIMVAMLVDKECRAAWIYDPVAERMTSAELGQGAYTNGAPISASAAKPDDALSGYTSLRYMKKDMQKHFLENSETLNMRDSISCAAHMYLDVAHGREDFTLFTRLKPWDHLPGILICQEAGAYAAKWDEAPYTIMNSKGSGVLTANSEKTWNTLHNMLISGLDIS